jgi:hypothetical protein
MVYVILKSISERSEESSDWIETCEYIVDVVEKHEELKSYFDKLIEINEYLKYTHKNPYEIPQNPKIGYTISILEGVDKDGNLIEYSIQNYKLVNEPSKY